MRRVIWLLLYCGEITLVAVRSLSWSGSKSEMQICDRLNNSLPKMPTFQSSEPGDMLPYMANDGLHMQLRILT
jgi:hypothetical protein